ncbi:MAG: trypsin-like peptidase domain-containing protein [Bacteroidales bacterium]|nr:trypsin-like peptidase domain-containing protein [Bacteroidales bacterium]
MNSVRSLLYTSLISISLNAVAQDVDWVTFPAAFQDREIAKGRPFVFANSHATDLNISNSGVFESYSDGTISWTIGVRSESSRNINVTLSDVFLGPSDELNIYSPDSSSFQSFRYYDVPQSGVVQSLPIQGDSLIVSLLAYDIPNSSFKISSVNCGFINLPEHTSQRHGHLKASAGSYGSSEDCEVNVSCDDSYAEIKQSVCRLLINGNSYGTGTLVNNTLQDGKPYVITAAHVVTDNKITSCLALFNFESPFCQDIEPNSSYMEKIQDATLVEIDETRDMALLCLSSAPVSASRPYWSGWNLSTDVSGMDRFYCIHHPYGDVRKVSIADAVMANTSYTYDKTNSGKDFELNNHWRVIKWISGTTEGGSSGSGLFDSNLRLIGSLSGGLASCRNEKSDYYWMLANNWDVLKTYLDPAKTGALSMNGCFLSPDIIINDFSAGKETPVLKLRPDDQKGYIAGHNSYHTTKISQKMGQDGSESSIYGVYLSPFVARSVHDQSFYITIWNDKDGVPGDVITTKQVNNKLLSAKKISYHALLDGPCKVQGTYHVGVEFSYNTSAVDTLAFYCQEGSGALFYADEKWQKATAFGSENDLSLFIGVRCTKSTSTPTSNSQIDNLTIRRVNLNSYQLSGSYINHINVLDITGRTVANYNIKNEMATISLDSFPSGIYIVDVNTSGGNQSFKVINRK